MVSDVIELRPAFDHSEDYARLLRRHWSAVRSPTWCSAMFDTESVDKHMTFAIVDVH